MTREFQDENGNNWVAFGDEVVVAHGKQGARLAFRPADDRAGPLLPTDVTFNSTAAANLTLRTLGLRELRRRLGVALAENEGP